MNKVHLLLRIKNTRIQPVLIRVLPSGVGVYLSPFKDVWGSRIIFAGPNKVFTQAKREQQRDLNHAVYSLDIREQLRKSSDYMNNREIWFDSKCKIKTSFYLSSIEDKVRVERYDKAMTCEFSQFEENSVHHSTSISSFAAGLASVQVNLEVDPVLHGL